MFLEVVTMLDLGFSSDVLANICMFGSCDNVGALVFVGRLS